MFCKQSVSLVIVYIMCFIRISFNQMRFLMPNIGKSYWLEISTSSIMGIDDLGFMDDIFSNQVICALNLFYLFDCFLWNCFPLTKNTKNENHYSFLSIIAKERINSTHVTVLKCFPTYSTLLDWTERNTRKIRQRFITRGSRRCPSSITSACRRQGYWSIRITRIS